MSKPLLTFGPPAGGWPDLHEAEVGGGGHLTDEITTPPARPRCYLAGPIRGDSHYKAKFRAGKKKLEGMGWEVVSPLDIMERLGQKPGVDADDRAGMAADIQELVHCSCVMLMTGWEQSRGAKAEVAVADSLEIPCYRVGGWPNA